MLDAIPEKWPLNFQSDMAIQQHHQAINAFSQKIWKLTQYILCGGAQGGSAHKAHDLASGLSHVYYQLL